jgi:enamine deaminase RidA (YjgF/YER057c/UK114 family)
VVVHRCIPSGSPYEQTVGFSRAVSVATPAGVMGHVAGTAPVWPDGTVHPDPLVQARRCWAIALGALVEAGGDPSAVVRTRTFLTDRTHEAAASTAHGELFADIRPASTMLVVAGLLDPRWLVEVELDAFLDPDG